MVDAQAIQQGNILEGMGLGGFNFGLGTIGTIFLWILISVFVVGIICGVVIYIYYRKAYNQKVWIFGLVGNIPSFKYDDKGKFFRIGIAGDRLFKLKKTKRTIPPPTIQMGAKLWWYYEREDGELINFSLKDLDEVFKKAGAYYVDTDMRMQRLGIQKNLEKRFSKESWFAKYGSTIAGVIFVIMVTVALVVLFAQLKDVASAMTSMANSVNQMASNVEQFYTERVSEAPSEVEGGSSNLVPAIVLPFLYLNLRRFKNAKKRK